MRLHRGPTKHQIKLSTERLGYRLIDTDGSEQEIPYPKPRWYERRVTSLWGLSTRFGFIGVMRLSKSEVTVESK